jgi:hypothetical protein
MAVHKTGEHIPLAGLPQSLHFAHMLLPRWPIRLPTATRIEICVVWELFGLCIRTGETVNQNSKIFKVYQLNG